MSKIAFIYPGQGAQKAGMGKDFYENSESARAVFDKASEILGLDMKALCFEENDKLDLTEYTQAALVTTCLAMTKVVREKGIHPDVTAGLSLGEYCAIAQAGGMSEEDAIRTVRKRGILMQNTVSGRGRRYGGSSWNGGRGHRERDQRDRRRDHCQLQLSGTDCDHRSDSQSGRGFRKAQRSRGEKSGYAQCQWTVPFTASEKRRRRTVKGTGKRGKSISWRFLMSPM